MSSTSIGNPIVGIRRSRSSYPHNEISYTGKMTSLYWIRVQAGPNKAITRPQPTIEPLWLKSPMALLGEAIAGKLIITWQCNTPFYSLTQIPKGMCTFDISFITVVISMQVASGFQTPWNPCFWKTLKQSLDTTYFEICSTKVEPVSYCGQMRCNLLYNHVLHSDSITSIQQEFMI